MIRLEGIELPSFGAEPIMPLIGATGYEDRLGAAVERVIRIGSKSAT